MVDFPKFGHIFQASMQQCTLPADWKEANVVPLFKKGDRSIASNYRPVSLTCICSKLLEHIVYSHIYVINSMAFVEVVHVKLNCC